MKTCASFQEIRTKTPTARIVSLRGAKTVGYFFERERYASSPLTGVTCRSSAGPAVWDSAIERNEKRNRTEARVGFLRCKNVSATFLALLFLLPALALAGNTGKIAGRVVDIKTKEPLIGANIVLVGTTLGASTDIDGKYILLNVPPGLYTLKASYVGYTAREYQNVQIRVDLTTTVDIELSDVAIEGEMVVVLGSRLIQKDATATAATFDAQNFAALPVETFEQALQIQAGVTVSAGGDIHIRGGRASELLFLVDGVPANNILDNTINRSIISTNAIQELTVISGAFNAEYGNAQSGVVNITTREAPRTYTGRISLQTGDVVGGDPNRFLNIRDVSPFNTKEAEAMIGGPMMIVGEGLSFFVSTRYFNDAGYLFGQRLVKYASDTLDNLVLGDRAYVSMNPDKIINVQGKLTLNVSNQKFVLSYLRKDRNYRSYSNIYRLAPDWRPVNIEKTDTYTLSTNNFFSNKMFLSGSLSYSHSTDQTYAFEDINDPRYKFRGRDLSYLANRNNPKGDSLAAILRREFGLTSTELVRFAIGPSLDRSERNSKRYALKVDITNQMGDIHLLKAGVEVVRYEVRRDGMSLVQMGARRDNDFNTNKEVIEIPTADTRSRNIFTGKPFQVAGYIQDKMEFPEFVLNVGLRYDVYNPNTMVPDNYFKLDATNLKKTATKSKLSPRLSFAHSVTDQSKIFFSYGHFFQLPPYTTLYTGQESFENPLVEIRTGILSPVGGDRAVGNPDLKPQTTISYEVGYEQELSENLAFYAKGYYRNIRNLLGTEIGFLSNGAVYAFYTNRDYGNVRGLSFTLRKRFSDAYAFSIDYTFQVAEGNASSPTQTYLNYRAEAQEQKQVVFLDWDQPHTLRWTLDYGQNGWQVGLVGKLESGYPYTPALGSAIQGGQRGSEENSGRKPDIFNVDLNASKEFKFSVGSTSISFGVFAKIYNVFDNRNELFVFSNSGRSTFSSDPALQGFVQFDRRPDFFSKPREIYVGTYIRF